MLRIFKDRPRELTEEEFRGSGLRYQDYTSIKLDQWLWQSGIDQLINSVIGPEFARTATQWSYVDASTTGQFTNDQITFEDWQMWAKNVAEKNGDYYRQFKGDFVIAPITNGQHWVSILIDLRKPGEEVVYYLDSEVGFVKFSYRVAKTIIAIKRNNFGLVTGPDPQMVIVKNAQKQQNGYDCGMYVVCNILKILEELKEKGSSFAPQDLRKIEEIDPVYIRQKRLDFERYYVNEIDRKNRENQTQN